MNFKKLAVLYLVGNIVIISFLAWYLLPRVRVKKGEIGQVSSVFPNWEEEDYWMGNGWKGKVFNSALAQFRILWKDEHWKPKPEFSKENVLFMKELKKFPGGKYYVKKAVHGYSVTSFFHLGSRTYWADMTSLSKFSKYKKAFDLFLENLEIGGEKSLIKRKDLEAKIPLSIMRSEVTVFFLSSGAILFLSVFYLLLFPIFGSCRGREGQCYSLAVIKFGRSIFSGARPCCLCISGDKAVAHTKFYKDFRFELSSTDFSEASKGKIKSKNFTIYLNRPLRISSQRKV